MAYPITKKTTFIIGSLLFVFVVIILFMLRYSVSPDTIIYSNDDSIVSTNDPLITQQLSERDLLPEDRPLITVLDPSRGNPEARVNIVEFSDFECPFCREALPIIEQILASYTDTVRHVWKDAPSTSLHKNALAAHQAARCAQEQGAFWEYHDELFANQFSLSDERYLSIARKLPINERLWQQCYESGATAAKVDRSITEAEVLGVDATPYFFINDVRVSGRITYEQIDQIIRNQLQ